MSDAKIKNAGADYDRINLDLARQVLDDSGNPEVAHLLDWARRVLERLGKK